MYDFLIWFFIWCRFLFIRFKFTRYIYMYANIHNLLCIYIVDLWISLSLGVYVCIYVSVERERESDIQVVSGIMDKLYSNPTKGVSNSLQGKRTKRIKVCLEVCQEHKYSLAIILRAGKLKKILGVVLFFRVFLFFCLSEILCFI